MFKKLLKKYKNISIKANLMRASNCLNVYLEGGYKLNNYERYIRNAMQYLNVIIDDYGDFEYVTFIRWYYNQLHNAPINDYYPQLELIRDLMDSMNRLIIRMEEE